MNKDISEKKKISESWIIFWCFLFFLFLILIISWFVILNLTTVNDNKTIEKTKIITEEEKIEKVNENKEIIKDNVIDSIHDISFNADEQMKFWVWIIATNEDWYLIENFDDFTVDKNWNLPSVNSRIKIETEEYNWYQPYKLDLSKKEDKRIYEAIQFIHEWFLKRIPNSSNLVKQFTYSTYKKDNLFKIIVWWISEEEKDTYFYFWKIEFDYIFIDDQYFWWYIDKKWMYGRWYWKILKSNWEIITFEDPKYEDSDEILTKKINDFLYTYSYNNSDIQKWNTLYFQLEKSNTIEKNWLKLICFQWDIEDLTYWYKVKTWDMCIVFKNKEFVWYSNKMNY